MFFRNRSSANRWFINRSIAKSAAMTPMSKIINATSAGKSSAKKKRKRKGTFCCGQSTCGGDECAGT